MSYATALSKVAELMQKVQQLERDNAAFKAENAALRSIAAAMAEEMEQHGGEMAFDSLAWYRAALAKEGKS